MPIVTPKTPIPANTPSDWVDTDGISNIVIGVRGKNYAVEFNLGGDMIYQHGGTSHRADEAVVIAHAAQVRVNNKSDDIIDFEVFE